MRSALCTSTPGVCPWGSVCLSPTVSHYVQTWSSLALGTPVHIQCINRPFNDLPLWHLHPLLLKTKILKHVPWFQLLVFLKESPQSVQVARDTRQDHKATSWKDDSLGLKVSVLIWRDALIQGLTLKISFGVPPYQPNCIIKMTAVSLTKHSTEFFRGTFVPYPFRDFFSFWTEQPPTQFYLLFEYFGLHTQISTNLSNKFLHRCFSL